MSYVSKRDSLLADQNNGKQEISMSNPTSVLAFSLLFALLCHLSFPLCRLFSCGISISDLFASIRFPTALPHSEKYAIPQVEGVSKYAKIDLDLSVQHSIASNDLVLCYALKNGSIRALHLSSNARAVLRCHSFPICDLQFAPSDSQLLLSVSRDGTVAVWKFSEPTPQRSFC